MNPGLKMMLVDRTRKMPEDRPEMRRPRMEYDNMEMRGRSRDRRGRFTGETEMNLPYDYAPYDDMEYRFHDNGRQEHDHRSWQRNINDMESRWVPPYYGETDTGMNDTGRYEMGGNGGRMEGEMEGEMEQRNPVGFAARFDTPGKADASYRGMKEGIHMRGPSLRGVGGAMSQATPKFNKRMADEWTAQMQNEDGSKGPHWSMDQVRQVMEQKKIDCDETEFFAVLNAIYSDYSAVAQKHGVNKQDFYLDMAKAFLQDKDAVKDKASAYYLYIVRH